MRPGTAMIFCCLLFPGWLAAQKKADDIYNKEVSFITENDAYLFRKADAYYTNGFFLRFTKAGEHKGKKITQSIEASQKIFTPLIRLTSKASDVDRPYAGLLSIQYNRTAFSANSSIWQYGIAAGTVGPSSFGKDVQDWYHHLLNYGRFTGWKYQVQNAVGVDFRFSYARTAWQDSNWIKLVPIGEAVLGSNFTNANIGMVTCVGLFADNAHSALWNARVQAGSEKKVKKTELFLYWYPQFILQGYNSTVQGGLFDKGDTTAVLGKINQWMFQQTWGACFARGRWTTRLAIVYQTREAIAQKNPQRYGTIQVGYRIH